MAIIFYCGTYPLFGVLKYTILKEGFEIAVITRIVSWIMAAVVAITILYGLTIGRFHYKTHYVELNIPELPQSFQNLRIVQLSDFHIGYFIYHKKQVRKIIAKVNELEPDIFLFTGDLISFVPEEAIPFQEVLTEIRAKYGKYSILGNHDYPDYIQLVDSTLKKNKIQKLLEIQSQSGLTTLMNSCDFINNRDDTICIAGVENWGLPPFQQYGDLKKAMQNADSQFTILLSHDPSHWRAEILQQTNIPLTLSGHTHGFQFGFEIGNWKWSPVKYKYPEWAGLYKESGQYLYVNRGIGCIGFPGRIGIRPEITLIRLNSKQ